MVGKCGDVVGFAGRAGVIVEVVPFSDKVVVQFWGIEQAREVRLRDLERL